MLCLRVAKDSDQTIRKKSPNSYQTKFNIKEGNGDGSGSSSSSGSMDKNNKQNRGEKPIVAVVARNFKNDSLKFTENNGVANQAKAVLDNEKKEISKKEINVEEDDPEENVQTSDVCFCLSWLKTLINIFNYFYNLQQK